MFFLERKEIFERKEEEEEVLGLPGGIDDLKGIVANSKDVVGALLRDSVGEGRDHVHDLLGGEIHVGIMVSEDGRPGNCPGVSRLGELAGGTLSTGGVVNVVASEHGKLGELVVKDTANELGGVKVRAGLLKRKKEKK